MSYCVQCGVELDASARACPLCTTPVINPAAAPDAHAASPYPPDKRPFELPVRRFACAIFSLVLSVFALVCLLANVLTMDSGAWSVYPIGALMLLWVIIGPLLLMKKPSLALLVALDAIALMVYLAVIALLTDTSGWVSKLALPIIAAVTLFVELFLLFRTNKRIGGWNLTAAVLWEIAALTIVIESSVDIYITRTISLQWSLVCLVPLAFLAVICSHISRNEKLRLELKKRLHL